MLIKDLIVFLLYLFASSLAPGYVLVRHFNLKSAFLKLFLSLTIGFCLSALSLFIGPWVWWTMVVVTTLIFFGEGDYKTVFAVTKIKEWGSIATLLSIIVLGTLFQNLTVFRSGLNYSYGIGYWGALGHDGVWHQALVNELVKGVPPQNPAYSGTTLTNYHYFYDLLVAQTTKITTISVSDLIYRYYPILFSIMLGIGTYFLVQALFKRKAVSLLATFLAYFGSSFGWIVEWVKNRTLGGESAFWANQPVSFNINPPFAISLLLMIAGIFVIHLWEEKRGFWKGFALVLLAGAMIEFKVYAGLIFLTALLILSLKKLIFGKDKKLILVSILAILISLGIFLPGIKDSSGFISFVPFWFIHSMVDIVDRVGWVRLSLARQTGLADQLWFKFITAELVGLAIFIVGNLGTRIIALIALCKIKPKEWFKDNRLFLIALLTFGSVIPTLLFVQKGNPWNIIQFFYYGLYFVAIIAAYSVVLVVEKWPKWLIAGSLILFIVITPVSSIATFKGGLLGEVTRISSEELAGLEFLKGQPDGVVLTYPYSTQLRNLAKSLPLPLWAYETSAYVSAYSNKTTYLEDTMQQEILGNNFQERLTQASKYFSGSFTDGEERSFLENNRIQYVYFPKPLYPLVNVKVMGEVIFENSSAIVYKIVNQQYAKANY